MARIFEVYKKLYVGLYLCFVLTVLATMHPLDLFESYSLIDSKSLKWLLQKLARQKRAEFAMEGKEAPGKFEMKINDQVKYYLAMPDVDTPETAVERPGPDGAPPMITRSRSEFQISTSKGLVDVLVSHKSDGHLSLSFLKNFETKARQKFPYLALMGWRWSILALCLILAFYLRPLYAANFFPARSAGEGIQARIIGLPLFVLTLAFAAGLIRFVSSVTACFVALGFVPGPALALFGVSLLLHAALVSLLTLGFTQEYVNKYIARPYFERHDPHGLRRGPAIWLSVRFFIIIFAIGVAPTALGLYLPVAFNVGVFADMASVVDFLEKFEILVPILITGFFALYFFALQVASIFSFRKNVIVPVNNLVARMQKVAKGDFGCKTSVLYVDEIGQLKGHFNMMLDGLAEREKIKDAFGKFMSLEIAEKLLKEKKVNLMGEEIEATVLFSDIRDFTPLSEKMDAAALVEFLNHYFSFVVKPIHANGGVVNKFIGDAVMAVFAPIFGNVGHEEAALRAALEMRRALAEFNALKRYPAVRAGVGIHRGGLVAGNIGTEERMEYTFIGDNVNIASRIESETKRFGADIIISEDVLAKIDRGRFAGSEFRPLGPVVMKGKTLPLELFGVVADGEKKVN